VVGYGRRVVVVISGTREFLSLIVLVAVVIVIYLLIRGCDRFVGFVCVSLFMLLYGIAWRSLIYMLREEKCMVDGQVVIYLWQKQAKELKQLSNQRTYSVKICTIT
jgi:hypothetical protein